jgi:hypothetical protein
MAAGGLVTFVLAKVTKTVSAEMLLCALGLCRTKPEKLRAAIFLPGYPVISLPDMQKFAMPCPLHKAGSFSGFLPKLIC